MAIPLPDTVQLQTNENGLDFLQVDSAHAALTIFLQGAHISSFQPKGDAPLLFMSPAESFREGKALRGGIPVCWPWFGPHPEGRGPHGFARTAIWELASAEELDSCTRLSLKLPSSVLEANEWPAAIGLTLEVEVGRELSVNLTTTNGSDESITLSQALHTYLPVDAIEQVRVEGLHGQKYLDQLTGEHLVQQGDVQFEQEVDRVYYDEGARLRLKNDGHGDIEVRRSGSGSVVVWNPWSEKSRGLSQFTPDSYHDMVCLEAANAIDDAVTLAPGQTQTLGTTVCRAK